MATKQLGYDLTDIDQLIAFDRDCQEAAANCPQYEGPSHVFTKHAISVAEVFQAWFECKTLWKSGYSDYLSSKAMATFDRYAVRKNGSIVDSYAGTVHLRSEKFHVRTRYEKEPVKLWVNPKEKHGS